MRPRQWLCCSTCSLDRGSRGRAARQARVPSLTASRWGRLQRLPPRSLGPPERSSCGVLSRRSLYVATSTSSCSSICETPMPWIVPSRPGGNSGAVRPNGCARGRLHSCVRCCGSARRWSTRLRQRTSTTAERPDESYSRSPAASRARCRFSAARRSGSRREVGDQPRWWRQPPERRIGDHKRQSLKGSKP
jgi:hypothetical protein